MPNALDECMKNRRNPGAEAVAEVQRAWVRLQQNRAGARGDLLSLLFDSERFKRFCGRVRAIKEEGDEGAVCTGDRGADVVHDRVRHLDARAACEAQSER